MMEAMNELKRMTGARTARAASPAKLLPRLFAMRISPPGMHETSPEDSQR